MFTDWLKSFCTITGSEECLRTLPPATCLGTQFKYDNSGLTVSMTPYIEAALSKAGMTDCNPAPTPMIPGFELHSGMCPDTDNDRIAIVSKVNEIFRTAISNSDMQIDNYKDATHFYAMLVSTIGWIANRVGSSIALAHSILGRVMHAPTIGAFQAVKRVFRYLQGFKQMCLHFPTPTVIQSYSDPDHIRPVLTIQSDASFADDASDRKSQGGYIVRMGNMGPCYWSSSKSKRVCTSTTHAETYHGSNATKHAVYVKGLLQFFGIGHSGSLILQLDSKSTVLTSGSRIRKFTVKQKHFDIDDLFLAQNAADGLYSDVVHVPGAVQFDNATSGLAADALTKPLSAGLLRHYFTALTGCPTASK